VIFAARTRVETAFSVHLFIYLFIFSRELELEIKPGFFFYLIIFVKRVAERLLLVWPRSRLISCCLLVPILYCHAFTREGLE